MRKKREMFSIEIRRKERERIFSEKRLQKKAPANSNSLDFNFSECIFLKNLSPIIRNGLSWARKIYKRGIIIGNC